MDLTDVVNSAVKNVRRKFSDEATRLSEAKHKLGQFIPGPEARQRILDKSVNIFENPLGKVARRVIPGCASIYEIIKWLQSLQDDEKTKSEQAGTHKVEGDGPETASATEAKQKNIQSKL
ncbi:hypothetical protein NE237_032182 [Protea cynaroides]|uniref:Uncharacterized protein n=1 Tax=Protea cynaroides TaxID=273540 RepID=A0A9Q0R3A7_9MAGN|nr:hypothetical protein NE237_032182 [Protea cynaroides]